MAGKRLGLVMGCMLLLGSVLTACSGSATTKEEQASGQTGGASEASVAPLDLTFLLTQQAAPIPKPDNPLVPLVEQYTNTKLNFQWVPSSGDAYNQKLNVIIASGDLPKIVMSKYNSSIVDAMKSGLFWEIGPYLKNYKNLGQLNPQYFTNLSVDGKIYAMPDIRPLSKEGFVYRKDWFDESGLGHFPVTTDDWLKVFRTQVKNHPGTYGFFEHELGTFQKFMIMQGGYNNWGIENGKIVPDFMGPAYMETLNFFRTAYNEHLINQNFATAKGDDEDNAFFSGKDGFMIETVYHVYEDQGTIQKSIPGAILDSAPLTGPKGMRPIGSGGNNGFLLISKSAVKTEAEVKRILDFFDKVQDAQMANLLTYGIEGQDYKVVDGHAVVTDADHYEIIGDALHNAFPLNQADGKQWPLQYHNTQEEKGYKITADNGKYAVGDPTTNLFSPTFADKGKELSDVIQTAAMKYIMGNIDENGWKAAVEKWKSSGGTKVMEEFTAAYQKSK